jgi:hypothetical protein
MMHAGSRLSIGFFIGLTWIIAPAWLPADVLSFREHAQSIEGLVDYYTFDGDFQDKVDGGNSFNDGAFTPTFTEGILGEGLAAAFNGLNHHLLVSRSIQDDFTIIVWVKADVSGACDPSCQFWGGTGLVYADWPQAPSNDFGLSLNGGVAAFGVGNGAGADDSGKLDLTDAISSLQFQFMGGDPPAQPGPTTCGVDPTPDDEVDCLMDAACR